MKDRSFIIGEMATSDSFECLWSFASTIDSKLSMPKTNKKDILKADNFLIIIVIQGNINFR